MTRDLTATLAASRGGDAAALSQTFEAAYEELRRLAHAQLRRLRPGQTLTTRSLVHEAFVKLVREPVNTEDRVHFFSLAARVMRQILVDYARQRGARKRGGDARAVTLDEAALAVETVADEMLAIDRGLARLHEVDERLARVVEWRFFGGMTEEEVAEAMGVTARTVRRDWQKARAFLCRELQDESADRP
jgi:RNA polymerase sigma factor (TIGR02999 family)